MSDKNSRTKRNEDEENIIETECVSVSEDEETQIASVQEEETSVAVPSANVSVVPARKKKKKKVLTAVISVVVVLGIAAAIIVPLIPDYVISKRPVLALADSSKNFAEDFRTYKSGTFEYEDIISENNHKTYTGQYMIDRDKREIIIGAEQKEQINEFYGTGYYGIIIGEKSGKYVYRNYKEELTTRYFTPEDLNFDLELLWDILDGNDIKPDKMLDTVDKNKTVTSIISGKKLRSIWGKFMSEFVKEENQVALEEAMKITTSDGEFHTDMEMNDFKKSCTVFLNIIDKAGKGKVNNVTMKLLKSAVKYIDQVLPDNFGIEADWDFRYRKLTKFSYRFKDDGSGGNFNMKYSLGRKLKSLSGEISDPSGSKIFTLSKFDKPKDPFEGIPVEVKTELYKENNEQ